MTRREVAARVMAGTGLFGSFLGVGAAFALYVTGATYHVPAFGATAWEHFAFASFLMLVSAAFAHDYVESRTEERFSHEWDRYEDEEVVIEVRDPDAVTIREVAREKADE